MEFENINFRHGSQYLCEHTVFDYRTFYAELQFAQVF
jgi:hypothetical protein